MLSKIITTGRDRAESISRMNRALEEFCIEGIKTNIPLLIAIMKDEDFKASNISTKFLENNTSLIDKCPSDRKTVYLSIENQG